MQDETQENQIFVSNNPITSTLKDSTWNDFPVGGYPTEWGAPELVRGYIIEYVPEPAALGLLGWCAAGLLLRRRRS